MVESQSSDEATYVAINRAGHEDRVELYGSDIDLGGYILESVHTTGRVLVEIADEGQPVEYVITELEDTPPSDPPPAFPPGTTGALVDGLRGIVENLRSITTHDWADEARTCEAAADHLEDMAGRSVDTSEALMLPCWWDAEGSGVCVEEGLTEDQATISIWDGQHPELDLGSEGEHAGCILVPESAMLLGRWLCSWAEARLAARTEVACANS